MLGKVLGQISIVITTIDDFVWGIPLIVLILSVGIYLTIRLKGLQITKMPMAIRHIRDNEKTGEHGEVSSFGALCTALSATIGTGNIVGVATALVAGGPGALFWMWLAALLGTATKYSECLLSIKYRVVAEDGHIIGGPFYYIEKGMGKNWKWLAKIFAFFGVGVGIRVERCERYLCVDYYVAPGGQVHHRVGKDVAPVLVLFAVLQFEARAFLQS